MISSRLNAHLQVAKAYAGLSKAKRLQVGAVIVKDDRPISVGYNGTPSGGSNICETMVDGSLVTKKEVIHAEKNAIAFAAKNGMSTNECTLVITNSPCFDCATLIIQAGIKEVYYETEFRDLEGVYFLQQYIKCERIKNGTN